METLWDVASGPEIDNLEVLEVPNTAERMNALMEEGVGREEAFRKASKEYRRVRETNQKVLMPVGKSLKELNRGVKRSTVVSYAAAAGHPIGWGFFWWHLNEKFDAVMKISTATAEAVKLAQAGSRI